MNPIFKNILAIIAGFVLGSAVNYCLIMLSAYIIPPPEGADITTMEGLQASIHLFEPKHFIMPFLSHAIGTLTGAFVCVKIAASSHLAMGMVTGLLFFIGGCSAVMMLSSPVWFSVLDLVVAYFPMAWLGVKLGGKG